MNLLSGMCVAVASASRRYSASWSAVSLPHTMLAAPSSSAIRASKASFDSGTLTWISPISVTTPLPANFS